MKPWKMLGRALIINRPSSLVGVINHGQLSTWYVALTKELPDGVIPEDTPRIVIGEENQSYYLTKPEESKLKLHSSVLEDSRLEQKTIFYYGKFLPVGTEVLIDTSKDTGTRPDETYLQGRTGPLAELKLPFV